MNVGTFSQSESPSTLQENLLQKFSVQSFSLQTLLLVVSRVPKLKVRVNVLIMGTIRALHYYLLFILVFQTKTPLLYLLLTEY